MREAVQDVTAPARGGRRFDGCGGGLGRIRTVVRQNQRLEQAQASNSLVWSGLVGRRRFHDQRKASPDKPDSFNLVRRSTLLVWFISFVTKRWAAVGATAEAPFGLGIAGPLFLFSRSRVVSSRDFCRHSLM
ncbi:hypothetical protein VFPPC_16325 [Pochonia chlamydosporia 170]|uniref:Uncharacterized protein n=1 Tax=Pochonia chlamydosporia 170 TaxID=1380566 RepID=A0A179FI16_METCM|nr:hypothetical protein VFPPC_16325 [Pochonia chlamydosporia 170]OAQ65275.1 hypothetical protein VFPPC_16325 [Pochonia chlamydosporia 170]